MHEAVVKSSGHFRVATTVTPQPPCQPPCPPHGKIKNTMNGIFIRVFSFTCIVSCTLSYLLSWNWWNCGVILTMVALRKCPLLLSTASYLRVVMKVARRLNVGVAPSLRGGYVKMAFTQFSQPIISNIQLYIVCCGSNPTLPTFLGSALFWQPNIFSYA
jgi:hypothetical protein